MWPSENKEPVWADEAAAWRHVKMVPTRLGIGLAVMVVLLWLVGLNYQANLAYIAAFWLLGWMAVAALQNVRQLLGLKLHYELPSEIFAGTEAEWTLKADGGGRNRSRWLWVVQEGAEDWREWRFSDGLSGLVLTLPAKRRGYLHLPGLRLSAAAPFGISMVEAVWRWQSDRVVFPAPVVHDVPLPFHAGEPEGQPFARIRHSDDLSHLQAHTPGHSLQHVAWKAYAKTGQMLDKRFESEKNRQRQPHHFLPRLSGNCG